MHGRSSPIDWPFRRANLFLIGELTKRDIAARYRGSFLGIAWAFFNPLLMLSVYAFVFSFVFKARWAEHAEQGKLDFALLLFIGLLIHGFLSDCMTRAPLLIVQNANYVKKVVFPLDIIPVSTVASAAVQLLIGSAIMLLAVAFAHGGLPATALLYPVIVAPLLLLALGVTWFFASLGVFLRDLAQAMTLFSTVLLFLSPVFYPVTALPTQFQALFHLNPLTFAIEQSRAAIFWGQLPDPVGWLLYATGGLVVCAAGRYWFFRTQHAFADVL